MHLHYYFRFDYKAFQQAAAPFVAQVEHNNFTRLNDYVRAALDLITPDTYLLKSFLTPELFMPTLDVDKVAHSKYQSSIVGHWFMLLLSFHLYPLSPLLGVQWRFLDNALTLMG